MSSDKHLFLIDGHALAYRSYYATIRTPMTNAKGQPTGAVLGFANSLLRLLEKYKPDHIVAVFDSPKPTFRHRMYEQYKAHREAMPDDLVSQLPLMFRLVDGLNIPRLMKDGLEADDIMAWLARRAAADGFTVRLVTRDKDLMQLVNNRIHLLAPESGGEMVDMGPAEVKAKMGVAPEGICDLLALMGDASDNIPGVDGVGPKTALKILEKAGTLDNLLADPACLANPKLEEKIRASREAIELSRKLVVLPETIDMQVALESLKARSLDKKACAELFAEMEFSSLLRSPLFDTSTPLDFEVIVPTTIAEVKALAETIRAAGFVSIDTETTSTDARQAKLVGISLAVDPKRAWYLPVGHTFPGSANLPLADVLAALKPVVESAGIRKLGQNLKYDYQVLKNHGLALAGLSFDAMVAGYLMDPGKRAYSLDAMAGQYLSATTTPIESLIGKRGKDQKCFSDVPVAAAAHYSGEDVVLPIRLKAVFGPMLDERNLTKLYDDLEMPLVTVLAEIECKGIAIDEALLAGMSREYTQQLGVISADIYRLAGQEFNLNSPKQIAEVLFDKLGLSKSKKTKTGLSTDVDALEKLAPEHPIAQRLLDYREVQKLLSTYIDALPSCVSPHSGRVHTSLNQTIAATGRLSSTDPNLQNIPVRTEAGARIREAFVAPAGRLLVSADYSQIELRILAHLSEDPFLQQAFHEDKDIHTQTASAIYGVFPDMVTPDMRRAAKTINFGLMYGMGPINLSRQLGIGFKEAQAFIDAYFLQFPSIHRFMDKAVDDARTKGYSETLLGRRRYLPELNSSQRQVRESAERMAINTPVQGTAADIIKVAMVHIHAQMGTRFPQVAMLLQVHDELVFEAPEGQAEDLKAWVVGKMSGAYKLSVPLKVDAGVGRNWRDAH
jgi:DNA polymerase I